MANPKPRQAIIQPLDKTYRFIPLTRGQIAIVDAIDFEFISKFNWYAIWHPRTKSFRAESYIDRKRKQMSQLICNSNQIDHKNRDTLDNRRCNLRPCTTSQNNANRKVMSNSKSGYKGVIFIPSQRKPWVVKIRAGRTGSKLHIGSFATVIEAAYAYDKAAKELYGEFACLNFPE